MGLLSHNRGSSPLARGLRAVTLRVDLDHGIIPARAGFTRRRRSARRRSPDHPRSRGVYGATSEAQLNQSGSSPLARGLQGPHRQVQHRPGIIPARAGFTRSPQACRSYRRDHPRSRGVYSGEALDGRLREGSSPLARGLRSPGTWRRTLTRIIPARAGFTCRVVRAERPGRDHPRSRGVYRRSRLRTRRRLGSSPLARGLPHNLVHGVADLGIIPARAGFTHRKPLRKAVQKDHPRSRGVYRSQYDGLFQGVGSSPLARGLLRKALYALLTAGIIPARAGFTWRRAQQ